MSLIAKLFGWIMYLIYQIIPSYGIAIILFTIVIKLLTLHDFSATIARCLTFTPSVIDAD